MIWELERGARVVASLAIPRVDEPDQLPDDLALLHAFLWANRWSAINRLAPQREQDELELCLISPRQSAVQVEDYQLYPVLKALLMPRISLMKSRKRSETYIKRKSGKMEYSTSFDACTT